MSSPPDATTADSPPQPETPSATATAGQSIASLPTAGSSSPASTVTAPSPCPPTTSPNTSTSATPPPNTAPKAKPRHASLTIVTDATTNRGLYVGATRGRNTNLILTVADDRDHAIERLTHVITNDRSDLPATVQRRHLLQDQTQPRPTRKPRCDIPDWFNGVYADARTEALQLRSRADKKEDAQVQRQRATTEAESKLPTAETAHAPFAQSVAASRQRVTAAANAKRSAWWALERSGRLGRRPAAKRLEDDGCRSRGGKRSTRRDR